MSIQGFIKDPVGYSRSHLVTFGFISEDIAGLRVRNQVQHQGWTSYRIESVPAYHVDFVFSGDTIEPDTVNKIPGGHKRLGRAALHTVVSPKLPNHLDKGICFLPFRENGVTYMQIPPSAKTFFTGPLSGCSIFIGEGTDGSLWAFHANRNNIEARQQNIAAKHAMTAMTADGVGVGIRLKHAAVKGQQYFDYAFVFGTKSWRGRWTFYVADLSSATAPCKVTALA